ncbi:MAG: AAA+ family ATPase [Alphaproteobacteria bacterium]|nr:MAG: AAA+ family ATPase [Alphaproteobacteria bacterium]
MRRAAGAALVAALLAAPAAEAGSDKLSEGWQRLGEGMRMLLEGISEEARPMIAELLRLLDDVSAYELPERLPNGDIIIRRKRPPAPAPDAPSETEL